ncbi:MAG: hypothetical protein JWN44_2404 [Myxococcales bacterium]|nr:hypothetical protein [Myxococcales bacterium]
MATSFTPLASDGQYVYGWGDRQIARIAVGGGAVETVVAGLDVSNDWSLIVDSNYVFWTWNDWPTNRVVLLRAPKTGGSATVLNEHVQLDVIADASSIVTGTPNGIVGIAKDSGTVSAITAPTDVGAVVAVNASYVYFLSRHGDATAPPLAAIRRVSRAGGASEEIAWWHPYGDGLPPRTIADGAAVFAWDFGRIVRVSFADGAVTTIFDGQNGPIAADRPGYMGIDDTNVYWVTFPNDDGGPPYTSPRYFLTRVGKDGTGAAALATSTTGSGHHVTAVGDSVYYDLASTLYRRCKM